MDAAAEIERNPVNNHHLFNSTEVPNSAWVWRMSRLMRDGTAEPVSRD